MMGAMMSMQSDNQGVNHGSEEETRSEDQGLSSDGGRGETHGDQKEAEQKEVSEPYLRVVQPPGRGEIRFSTSACPNLIVLEDNGDIFLRGELLKHDLDLVDAFWEFIRANSHRTKLIE